MKVAGVSDQRGKGSSLRTRMALLIAGLNIVLSVSLGGWLWHSVREASSEALDRELGTIADALSQLIHLHGDGRIEVENHGSGELAIPHRLEAAKGEVLSEGGLRWPRLGAGTGSELISIDGHPWRVLSRQITLERKGRQATVMLRVATSARPMVELRARVGRAVLAATLLAAIAGALGAAIVARSTTSPLRALASRVEGLGASSLGEAVEPLGRDREVVALTSSFNGLLRRLHAAFERQRSFVARASHALRTPTATILTRAEVTLARSRSGEEYRLALEEIAEAARESAKLVDHLLSLARLEERSTELRPKPILLEAVAEELERALGPRALAGGVALSFEIEAGTMVTADRAALRELLEVLLDNALRYTPRGAAAGLRADRHAIVVWDSGEGMSEADKDRAFERFFRGKAAEASGAQGSGLGLSIAKAVVDRHHGSIALADRVGGGLEVIVCLPPA